MQPGHAAAQGRVPGKRHLERGREDPDPIVGGRVLGRQQEGGLSQIGPGSEPLHRLGIQPLSIHHHGKPISLGGSRAEHITLNEPTTDQHALPFRVNERHRSGTKDTSNRHIFCQKDGYNPRPKKAFFPSSLFERNSQHTPEAPMTLPTDTDRTPMPEDRDRQSGQTLRLHDEQLQVNKETVETGRVHVSTQTHTRDAKVSEDLARERVEIETVPIGRRIDAMPPVRQEGDVTIVPIVEEVVVVERRLMLKEEVRIRKVRTIEHHEENVTLRYQEAVVSRTTTDPTNAAASLPAGADKAVPTNSKPGV